MQGHRLFFRLLGAIVLFTASCMPANERGEGGSLVAGDLYAKPKPCGETWLTDVRALSGKSMGLLQIFNDSANLYISYAPPTGATLVSFQLFYGEQQKLPLKADQTADPAHFPLRFEQLNETTERTISISLEDMPSCIAVAGHIEIIQNGEVLVGDIGWTPGVPLPTGLKYCKRRCNVAALQCSLGQDQVLPQTVSQDQWLTAEADKPAQLLRNHFKRIFPTGISLGCNDHVEYGTADAALAAMPSTGAALPLSASAMGPEGNRLAGELLSLTLMAHLDEVILEFTPHSAPLKHLVVSTGAFEGWSVEEVLAEANIVLGGCTTNFSADQIYQVVREINMAFATNGTPAFLRCP
jgi:hypothetical protein